LDGFWEGLQSPIVFAPKNSICCIMCQDVEKPRVGRPEEPPGAAQLAVYNLS
jgi:hypothetical protein